jgi:putative membrane protein
MHFLTGFLIGCVSLIPGISSGTILVIINQYEEITNLINKWYKKESILKILTLLIGILIGAITSSKIIELCLILYQKQTMFFFAILILSSIPKIIKNEKINYFYLILGLIIIFILNMIAGNSEKVIINYPSITFSFLISFSLFGMLDGFLTIIPGISGSMVLMILGPYFLYKSYLANVFNNLIFIIPLLSFLIGDLLGIFLGSKFSLYFLEKYHSYFASLIIGMVICSALILIPIF